MKKTSLYIIITILLMAIASGTTYIILNNNYEKNNKNIKESDKENNNKEQDNQPTENIKPETITLKEEELKKYLGYVPNYQYVDDMIVYNYQKKDLNNIGEKTLIAIALSEARYECGEKAKLDHQKHCIMKKKIKYLYDDEGEFETEAYTFDEIKKIMLKMYNYQINNLAETTSWDTTYSGAASGFAYQDGYFLMVASGLGDTNNYLSEISKYEATKDELTIWEHRSYYDWNTYSNNYVLMDYLKKKMGEFKTEEETQEYFKHNQDKFTEYKHIFKKNSTGYYWYSTEAVD